MSKKTGSTSREYLARLISLGLPYVLVDPATWQSAQGLFRWQQKFKVDASSPTILSQASARWPGAPFNTRPDDGVAAALLIADLALQDHLKGIDRESLQLAVSQKKKVKKRKERAFKKAQDNLWGDLEPGGPLPVGVFKAS